ncbi:hypothetical protein BSKO_03855 [Bryopsis sp. KO-2023]|nr:hypothetical protein BSKO_03855 [Bryopsis sp. KO-2023]
MLPSLQKSSVPCGSCCSIPIKLHLLFPIFLVIQALSQINNGVLPVLMWFIVLGPFLMVTILLHEFGHSLTARKLGAEVHGILLWPLGGLAFVGHSATPKVDFLVALAGPMTHIPQLIIWILLLYLSDGEVDLKITESRIKNDFWNALLAFFIVTNIVLMLFNLFVPAFPLDGGRLVADTLLMWGVSDDLTAKIMVGLSVPMGAGVVIWGIVEFSPVTILVGLWILYSSWGLISALRNGTVSEHPLFLFTSDMETSFQDSTSQL